MSSKAKSDAPSAAPASAPAGAPAAAEPEEPSEFMKALKWSPPAFVMWGFGYVSDFALLCVITLMLMPWATDKVVELLGGRGAWAALAEKWGLRKPRPPPPTGDSKTQAKKAAKAAAAEAAAEANRPATFKDALRVPLSVWLPPIMLVAATVDPEKDLIQFASICTGVYGTIVLGQHFRNKVIGRPKVAGKHF